LNIADFKRTNRENKFPITGEELGHSLTQRNSAGCCRFRI